MPNPLERVVLAPHRNLWPGRALAACKGGAKRGGQRPVRRLDGETRVPSEGHEPRGRAVLLETDFWIVMNRVTEGHQVALSAL